MLPDYIMYGSAAFFCFVASAHIFLILASSIVQPEHQVYVSLVCRSNYKAIAENGVQLHTRDYGSYHFAPYKVFSSISHAAQESPEGGWAYVMVTTKALPDITNDAADIAPLIAPGGKQTCVVLVQNGVGVEAVHREHFPGNPIVSAVTVISAAQESPGVIRQNRWTRISMGPYTDGIGDEQSSETQDQGRAGKRCVKELVDLFKSGGVKDAEDYDEKGLQLVRWHKICINGSMNPSAVLSGGTGNSRMSLDAELRIHLKGCMDEVFVAAPAVLGRPFPEKLARPDKILTSTERNTSGKPSMLLDWEAGRPMEIEVILGNPIRIARRAGVEMPRLQSLYALLKMAQLRRGEDAKAAKTNHARSRL